MNASDWPPNSHAVQVFAGHIAREGSRKFITNVDTTMMVLCDGGFVLPVTINDTEYDNSYVCSMLTYYRYMKDELKQLGVPSSKNCPRGCH